MYRKIFDAQSSLDPKSLLMLRIQSEGKCTHRLPFRVLTLSPEAEKASHSPLGQDSEQGRKHQTEKSVKTERKVCGDLFGLRTRGKSKPSLLLPLRQYSTSNMGLGVDEGLIPYDGFLPSDAMTKRLLLAKTKSSTAEQLCISFYSVYGKIER